MMQQGYLTPKSVFLTLNHVVLRECHESHWETVREVMYYSPSGHYNLTRLYLSAIFSFFYLFFLIKILNYGQCLCKQGICPGFLGIKQRDYMSLSCRYDIQVKRSVTPTRSLKPSSQMYFFPLQRKVGFINILS